MIGIYKITNLTNGHCYIGQSRQIEKRWSNHKSTAFNPMDHNYESHLYKAIRKYGLENFSFEVIEECLIDELNEKERYWITYYDSFFNGYNLTFGGDGSGNKVNKEKIIGIINDLETTTLFQKDIAAKWDISEEMVQGINTGRYWKHDRKYPIREKKEKKEVKYYCSCCGKEITKKAKMCRKCCDFSNRTVQRPSRNELKELIRTVPFVKISKKYGVSDNAIRKWCIAENLPSKKKDIKSYSDKEWELI